MVLANVQSRSCDADLGARLRLAVGRMFYVRRQLADGRGWTLTVQCEMPRTPTRDLMEGNSFSPQFELDSR